MHRQEHFSEAVQSMNESLLPSHQVPDFKKLSEDPLQRENSLLRKKPCCPSLAQLCEDTGDEYDKPKTCGERLGIFVQNYIGTPVLDYTKGFLTTLGLSACGISAPLTVAGGALRASFPFINAHLVAPIANKICYDWSKKIEQPAYTVLASLVAAGSGSCLIYGGMDLVIGDLVQNDVIEDAAIGLIGYGMAKATLSITKCGFWNRSAPTPPLESKDNNLKGSRGLVQ